MTNKMFQDYSTQPVDILDEMGNWISTYRYEPFLKKWFYIEPDMKAELEMLETKDVPKEVIDNTDICEYEKENSYYAPIKVQIQVNKGCNYRCKICYASSSNFVEEEMSIFVLDELFYKIKSMGVIRVNLVGGEPFFRKDILEICQLAHKHRLLFSLITNGLIGGLNYDKYRWIFDHCFNIQVSCNGYANSYLYEYSAIDWKKAKNAISQIIMSTKVNILSFVISDNNVNDIERFISFANEINAYIVKFGTICWSGRAKSKKQIDYYKKIIPKAKNIIDICRRKYPKMKIQSQIDFGNDTPLWEEYSNGYRPFEFYFSPEGKDSLYIKSNGNIYPFPLLSDERDFLIGTIDDNIELLWKESKVLKKLRTVTFHNSDCGKLNCKRPCGLWNRSYAYAWSRNLFGKVPCHLTDWQ